jgi:hypothetical protein
MDIQSVTVEPWPTFQLPREEVKATYSMREVRIAGQTHSLVPEQISCMGAFRREGNIFIVERFHLVKQEGGIAHTEVAPNALGELVEQLMAGGKMQDARALKCWAHSHPGMGMFWSKTDDTTEVEAVGDDLPLKPRVLRPQQP